MNYIVVIGALSLQNDIRGSLPPTAQSSSSSFYLNQATWPVNINKRHTDRQIDSISERKKEKSNTRCTIKHSKLIKFTDGHTDQSSFTISLL